MPIRFLSEIERSIKVRESLLKKFEKEKTDCYRLFNGTGEGVPGLIIDRYREVLIFQWHEGKCHLEASELESLAAVYGKEIGIQSVYLKSFVTDRSSQIADATHYLSQPLWGKESLAEIICHENGMKLAIRPYEGFSTGIFLDQRNNRSFLREHFQGREVLNCFSYTCAFSVACALNGNKITSVDLSKRYLDWGKNNFNLNGIVIGDHFFYSLDVFLQFKRAKKLQKTYDLIILDPPSFSRNSEGKTFSVKKDMKSLITGSCELLNPNGVLFISSNLTLWNSPLLQRYVAEVLVEMKMNVEWIKLPIIPDDFLNCESPLSACCFKRLH